MSILDPSMLSLGHEDPSEFTFVKLRNAGSEPFQDTYANRPFRILPGEEIIVPFYAAVYWFGNPYSVDTDKARDRTDEWKRMRVKYGVYDDLTALETNMPKVEMYDANTNERLYHVIDDPDGNRNRPDTPNLNDVDQLKQQLLIMQKNQEQLMKMLDQQVQQDMAIANAKMDTTETPEHTPDATPVTSTSKIDLTNVPQSLDDLPDDNVAEFPIKQKGEG